MEKPDSRKGENSLSIIINEMERSAFAPGPTQIGRERDPQQFSCRTNLFLKTPFIIVAFNIEHHNSFLGCVFELCLIYFSSLKIIERIMYLTFQTTADSLGRKFTFVPKVFSLENFCNQSMNETQTIRKNFYFSRRKTSQFSVSYVSTAFRLSFLAHSFPSFMIHVATVFSLFMVYSAFAQFQRL